MIINNELISQLKEEQNPVKRAEILKEIKVSIIGHNHKKLHFISLDHSIELLVNILNSGIPSYEDSHKQNEDKNNGVAVLKAFLNYYVTDEKMQATVLLASIACGSPEIVKKLAANRLINTIVLNLSAVANSIRAKLLYPSAENDPSEDIVKNTQYNNNSKQSHKKIFLSSDAQFSNFTVALLRSLTNILNYIPSLKFLQQYHEKIVSDLAILISPYSNCNFQIVLYASLLVPKLSSSLSYNLTDLKLLLPLQRPLAECIIVNSHKNGLNNNKKLISAAILAMANIISPKSPYSTPWTSNPYLHSQSLFYTNKYHIFQLYKSTNTENSVFDLPGFNPNAITSFDPPLDLVISKLETVLYNIILYSQDLKLPASLLLLKLSKLPDGFYKPDWDYTIFDNLNHLENSFWRINDSNKNPNLQTDINSNNNDNPASNNNDSSKSIFLQNKVDEINNKISNYSAPQFKKNNNKLLRKNIENGINILSDLPSLNSLVDSESNDTSEEKISSKLHEYYQLRILPCLLLLLENGDGSPLLFSTMTLLFRDGGPVIERAVESGILNKIIHFIKLTKVKGKLKNDSLAGALAVLASIGMHSRIYSLKLIEEGALDIVSNLFFYITIQENRITWIKNKLASSPPFSNVLNKSNYKYIKMSEIQAKSQDKDFMNGCKEYDLKELLNHSYLDDLDCWDFYDLEIAICQVIRAISRSTGMVRTHLMDSGIGFTLMNFIKLFQTGECIADFLEKPINERNSLNNNVMNKKTPSDINEDVEMTVDEKPEEIFGGEIDLDNEEQGGIHNVIPLILLIDDTMLTFELSEIDYDILREASRLKTHSCLTSAMSAITNFCHPQSPLKDLVLKENGVKYMTKGIHSDFPPLRLTSMWALKHVAINISDSKKISLTKQIGLKYLLGLCDDPELQAQEQALCFIQNISYGAQISIFFLNSLYYEKLIDMFSMKISKFIQVSSYRKKIKDDSESPYDQPYPGITLAVLYTLGHFSVCSTEGCEKILEREDMLRNIAVLMRSDHPGIRLACIRFLSNVIWLDDIDRNESKKLKVERAKKLMRLGFEEDLKLRLADADKDVCERAKCVLFQFNKLVSD